jgi:hypothetical protein
MNCVFLFLMASDRSNFAYHLANVLITVLFSFELIVNFCLENSEKDYPAMIRMFIQGSLFKPRL